LDSFWEWLFYLIYWNPLLLLVIASIVLVVLAFMSVFDDDNHYH